MAVARVDEIEDGSSKSSLSLKDIKEYFQVHLMYITTPKSMWQDRTYLHFTLDLIPLTGNKVHRSEKIFNDPKEMHAEEKLLKYLKKLLDEQNKTNKALDDIDNQLPEMFSTLGIKDTQEGSINDKTMMKMNLQIVINYSPCKSCAEQIEDFKNAIQKKCDCDITIIFGSFYKIYPETDENKHIEGLTNLHKAGIKLQLSWDCEFLKETLEKIGTKVKRLEREKKDREYLKLVIEKAKNNLIKRDPLQMQDNKQDN